MPLLSFVWGFIAAIIPVIIVKIITALGITFLAFKGFDWVIEEVKTHVISGFTSIPPEILDVLALTGIGVAINSMLSAMTAVITYKIFVGSFNVFKFGGD